MTRQEVEESLDWVLGKDINAVLTGSGVNLPKRLDLAAIKAFREDWPNDSKLERLRGALSMLHRDGYFSFEDGNAG